MSSSKRCVACLTLKPATREYYHSDGGDRLRPRCKACENARRTGKTIAPPVAEPALKVTQSARYLVTYAQNATPVHAGFWAALRVYAKETGAKLLVIPGRYHNPTSIWSQNAQHSDWWAPDLEEYLFAGRHSVGPNLTIYGDISIQPTAVRPLSGFEVFAGASSAVFGHPRLQLQTIATATRQPRLLFTTGAVTLPNYTDSKAGKRGDAHHVFGAAVIERAGKYFYTRQINAEDDGSFIDLDKRYTPDGVEQAPPALALVCGDIHVEKSEPAVLNATLYAEDSIASVLKPQKIIYHDVLDFEVRNHHTINSFTDRYHRAVGKRENIIENELKRVMTFLESTPKYAEPVVIASNHDEAFDRWLQNTDPRQDPINARLFHKMWAALLDDHANTGVFAPALETYAKLAGHTRTKFVRRNEEYRVADITCGFHGDKGLNGSRGSTQSMAKLGVKTISGHSHQPAILDGAYVTGVVAQLDHGYNLKPSGWLHCSAVVYPNGKRTLLIVIDGKWRL